MGYVSFSNLNIFFRSSSFTFTRGDCLYASESVVRRRQILTYKDDPRTHRIQIFILVVHP